MFRSAQADRWPCCGRGRSVVSAMLITAAVLSAGPESACGQCQYEVTAIIEGPPGCPFGGNGLVQPQDMNDNGEIVGYWFCQGSSIEFAFRWDAESGLQTLELPVPDLVSSRALGINNYGDTCGWYVAYDADKDDYWGAAFVLKDDGEFINIPVPEGGTNIEAHAINDSGQVCGTWSNIITGPHKAFVWHAGKLETLKLPMGPNSRGYDINDQGVATGEMGDSIITDSHAFVWQNGTTIDGGMPPGGTTGSGLSINECDDIAGYGIVEDGSEFGAWRAFARIDGQIIDCAPLDGYFKSNAYGINNAKHVVGRSQATKKSNNDSVATIWLNGQPYNLAELSDVTFVGFDTGHQVNESGRILVGGGGVGYLVTPLVESPADLTLDCVVNTDDLLELLQNWSTTDSFADIDNNGVVGVSDLLMLLADWSG